VGKYGVRSTEYEAESMGEEYADRGIDLSLYSVLGTPYLVLRTSYFVPFPLALARSPRSLAPAPISVAAIPA
jgi:hypothetical protein